MWVQNSVLSSHHHWRPLARTNCCPHADRQGLAAACKNGTCGLNPEFLQITPAPACLAPFVRRFFYANRKLAAPIPMTPKPTGYHYFSNFLSEGSAASVWYILGGRRLYRPSRWNLAGQITDVEIRSLAERELRVMFCELSPTAPHRLYVGISPASSPNRSVSLPRSSVRSYRSTGRSACCIRAMMNR